MPKIKRPNPYTRANFISKLFYCWLTPLFIEGWRNNIGLDDIYSVIPEDSSKLIGDELSIGWNNEVEKCSKKIKPSLTRVIWKVFRKRFILVGLFAFVQECILKILQPLTLGYLIKYFNGSFKDDPNEEIYGYLLSGFLILLNIFVTFTHHPYFFGVQHIGSQIRIGVSSIIYRKSLTLSQGSIGLSSIGQIVNLLSNDVNRFDQTTIYIHYLWIGPIQFGIITSILWLYFGYSCFTGLGILLLLVPIQGYIGSCFSKLRNDTAKKTDERIQRTNEIINGIKFIKMYAWENSFANIINNCRTKEIQVIRKSSNLRSLNVGIFFVSAKLIVFGTLLTYVLTGNSLNAEIVFVSIALYNNLRPVMTLFLPSAVAQLAEAKVSIKRIEDFLLMEERKLEEHNNIISKSITQIHSNIIGDFNYERNSLSPSIVLNNFYCKWNPSHDEYTLSDINLKTESNELICIIGNVGSGKSSLLNGILEELPPTNGNVSVIGSIAYTSQEPWVFSGTLRDNILFGSEYKSNWYKQILEVCALTKDLEELPNGDLFLVGENGSNLSGGQKSRISLARACYSNSDIYLLDDPLSSVDSIVGKYLFDNCINGLLKDKLRLLVTHQIQYLKSAQRILLIKNGIIQLDGSYSSLLSDGSYINNILKEYQTKSNSQTSSLTSIQNIIQTQNSNSRIQPQHDLLHIKPEFILSRHGSITSGENTILGEVIENMDNYKICGNEGIINPNEESQTVGTVSFNTYWTYFKSGTTIISFLLLILSNIITQILYTTSDLFLGYWTIFEEKNNGNITENNEELKKERNENIILNSSLIFFLCIFSVIRVFIFFKVAMTASISLHYSMFNSVLRSPMKFFEENNVGRILNRFSKDIGLMDEMMPLTAFDTIAILLMVFGVIVLLGILNPILLAPATLLIIILHYFRKFYLKTGRNIKRIEGIARSPVFSHLSTSLHGLSTIRAYKKQKDFIKQFDEYQDLHSSSWFLFIGTSRWFGFILDWMCIFYITSVIYSFFIFTSKDHGGSSSSNVGLGISSVLMLTGMLQWGIRQSAEVENQFVAVERIIEYTKLKPEAPLLSKPGNEPPPDWPMYGEIELINVNLCYGNDIRLTGIRAHILPGEKIGVVGRTGAGKSSLINGIFRIVEPSGQIIIDGINIFNIGLHELRSKISIIPQEPFLFKGTLRSNLDPFNQFRDYEIWDTLQDISLYNDVKQYPEGLEIQINEGGNNFSQGQKQLICLGRAILMKNKILVLDEATANVDPQTDEFIQETIRKMFNKCTVITVAHRLNTIMDSDRIMVLSTGKIVELDVPYKLLQNKDGVFYSLVQETGKSSMDNLIHLAKDNWEKRQLQQ